MDVAMGGTFVPGDFWTPERARDAVERMTAVMASAEFQALITEIATAAAAGGDPAALAAQIIPSERAGAKVTHAPIEVAACSYRRGRAGDVPDLARLVVAGELPPLFIEEFVQGFVVVECGQEIVGCGGLEVYDGAAVIRSVVVEERARGLGIGARIAGLLLEEARQAHVGDVYLFTMHAYDFWRRCGFVDAPLDTWKEGPRTCWQYQFIAQHPKAGAEVYRMWRTVA